MRPDASPVSPVSPVSPTDDLLDSSDDASGTKLVLPSREVRSGARFVPRDRPRIVERIGVSLRDPAGILAP